MPWHIIIKMYMGNDIDATFDEVTKHRLQRNMTKMKNGDEVIVIYNSVNKRYVFTAGNVKNIKYKRIQGES